MITDICMKCQQIPNSSVQFFAFNMPGKNNCTNKNVIELKKTKTEKKNAWLYGQSLPKVTNPAFAVSASAGAPFNSRGGDGDHIQGGALLSAAVRLASTNS